MNILVIDDNEDDRELYRRALQKISDKLYSISEVEDGEAGLASIAQQQPACVLLDYSLPGRNGIEVLKRVRQKYPYLPVIMLTGQGNEAIAVQSIKEGAHDYIVKSTITPEALQRVIRVAIEHSSLEKRIHDQRASLEIFTRALAHDLKEPVRTIRSFLGRIDDRGGLSEKSQKYFDYIRKAADRMNALIDTVYLYTRLDAAEDMEKTSCDIADVLEEVKENLAQLIEERDATITSDALPLVHANRVQMMQLFQNLVTNAIRHCESPVTIHVDCEERGEYWQLAVRDNGPGIAQEYLEKIFAPFKRLSHRKEDGPGLGLGLAINRKIVESYGGTIWCQSTPGSGTAFLFTLLKAKAGPVADNNVSKAPFTVLDKRMMETLQTPARILLVDDNESDIELNRLMLIEEARLECEVLTACDGREALAKLQSAARENNPIDLILLDINMPGMSGFELLAQMHKEDALLHTMVVMCTTSAYDMDKRMATSLGAAGYLTKPPEFSLLREIIDRCQHLRLRQENDNFTLLRTACG